MKKTFVLSIVSVMIMMFALMSASAYADLATNQPSVCSGSASPWTLCGNAFGNNINQSTAAVSATLNRTSQWRNYGFSIPSSALINSVIVRADFWASRTSGRVNIRVSTDGGNTWGPNHVVGNNTAEKSYFIDVTNDFAWTPSMLNNANLRVNSTCFKVGGGTNPTCRLDWVPVNVTYTIPFDFSVSVNPTSGSVVQARSISTDVTATLLSGTTENVALSVVNCPTAATCTLNPTNGNPTYTSTLNISTTSATPAGSYIINVTGNSATLARSATYTLNVTDSQPAASASANPTSGVSPLTVNFTGGVTGGDAPLSYFWDFKDGSNSTQQNPQHTYNTAGTYNATFTATDYDGDQSTSNAVVTVNNQFDFAVSTSPATASVAQARNTATNVTVNLLSGDSQLVNLAFSGCPIYAMCTLIPNSGLPSYTATLTVSTVYYTPAGTYNIQVTGTNGSLVRTAYFNVTVTDSLIVVNKPTANPGSGTAPLTVNFSSLVIGGDAPISYLWTFGDGNSSTASEPSHTYYAPGNYVVNLTVTDFDLDFLSNTTSVTVNEACVRNFPTVSIKPDIQSGAAGSTLNYTTNVTNTDTAVCGGSTFNMSYSPPGDWSAVFSSDTLVIVPGETKSTVFSLTSAANATGSNVFYNMALNTASGYQGSDWAEYNVTG